MQLIYFDLHDLSNLSSEHLRTIETVYEMWEETYRPIVSAANEDLHPDSFFRARYLLCIYDSVSSESSQPVAFCLMNSIDLKIPQNAGRSYFRPVPYLRMKDFVSAGDKILTVEWVTVRPANRVQFKKVQLVDLVMGAAFRFMHRTNHTLAMGYSRIDVGADRVAASFGVRPFDDIQLHGISCRLMIGRREWVGKHRFAVVESAIETLWSSARNFTSIHFDSDKVKTESNRQSSENTFENTRNAS